MHSENQTQADDFRAKLDRSDKKSIYTLLEDEIKKGTKQLPQPMKVPLEKIDDSDNTRTFDTDDPEFAAFALSLRTDGLMNPILVWYDRFAQSFSIIAGHRRFAGTRFNGEKTIAAYINLEEVKSKKLSLVENVLRKDITPIEYCEGLQEVKDQGGYSQAELSKIFGTSQSKVSSCLGIAKWERQRKDMIRDSSIPITRLIDIYNQRANVDIGVALRKALREQNKKAKAKKSTKAERKAVSIPVSLSNKMESFFSANPNIQSPVRTKLRNVVKSYSGLNNPDKSKFKEFLGYLFTEDFKSSD